MLLERAECITCPPPPACNCAATERCVQIVRGCGSCESIKCVSLNAAKKSGISAGTLAGAVVGILIFALLVFAAYFWWRRKSAARPVSEIKPKAVDVPASADTVLSRPDPIEKALPSPSIHKSMLGVPIGPTDALSERSAHRDSVGSRIHDDPFADQVTIQTASARTESPNVITIGLIQPPDGLASPTSSKGPMRPARSPEVSLRSETPLEATLNLAHVNVSGDTLNPPTAKFARPASTYSGRSGMTAMSSASSTFDIINEAPQIVTPVQGAVRQVLGVARPEVVKAPPTTPANSTSSLLPPPRAQRPTRPARSPLGQSAFGPDEEERNPFEDSNQTPRSDQSSVRSASTFGSPAQWTFPPTPAWQAHQQAHQAPPSPTTPTRPQSVVSTAGTIVANIGNATRVVFGVQSPHLATTPSSAVLSPALPGTPPPNVQNHHLSVASAATSDQGANRLSQASIVSATSSRADSILEAFPFVPPSPISALPPRSPQGSTFAPPSPSHSMHSINRQPAGASQAPPRPAPPPPGMGLSSDVPPSNPRRAHAVSTVSAVSSSSAMTGLDSYTFQFSDGEMPPMPNSAVSSAALNSTRASLDTLALSRDLEAFPLPYDAPLRDSFAPSAKG